MAYSHPDKVSAKTAIAIGAKGSETDLFTSSESLGTSAASKLLGLDANSELNGIGVLQATTVSLTATQVGALNGTPVTIVSAATTGKIILPEFAIFMLDYGGTAAWTATGGGDLIISAATGPVTYITVEGTTLIEVTADTYHIAYANADDATAKTAYYDVTSAQESALVLANDGTDYTCESLATATVLRVRVWYRVVTLDISS